jgi:hypothetical protein
VCLKCGMTWLLAVVLRPLGLLVLFGLILLPARLAAQHLPDGKLRRLLLTDVKSVYLDWCDSPNWPKK